MSLFDPFGYRGKRALVVGGATGMGAAVAEVVRDAGAEGGGRVDALFSCAGVADGTPGIEKINFIGHRYMIDRMLAAGMFPAGSSIGFIFSAAGMGWEAQLPLLQEFLDIHDFDDAVAWVQKRGKADYMWS